MLEACDVHKTLGATHVLRGASVDIPRGSVTAIIGPSGSGKSTLLRCLNLLIVPDSGSIRWDGQEMGTRMVNGRRVPRPERELLRYRCDVGMVFQSFNLFPHMTALQNIMEAPVTVRRKPPAEAREQALLLLDRVRLSHRAQSYPHQMSGGEQQRVAIARALAMEPKAMLFDEVTSALDPELKSEVLTTMRDLADDGMTMVVVSHEISFVRQAASRFFFMMDGQVVEQGKAEALDAPTTPELSTFLSRIFG